MDLVRAWFGYVEIMQKSWARVSKNVKKEGFMLFWVSFICPIKMVKIDRKCEKRAKKHFFCKKGKNGSVFVRFFSENKG